MNFLYPSFLWALLALAIPLIVHLFNFKRYKTVYFSNNRFLKAVQKKSQHFSRLKHWIILCSRLLALLFLVFAFAQPFLPAKNKQGTESSYASFYIDNSLSMKSKGVDGPLLDQARGKAIELIKTLPSHFKIQIVSNHFEGRQQQYYSPSQAIDLIEQIEPSYAFRNIKEVENRILAPWQQLHTDKGKLQVFILSDFQKTSFEKLNDLNQEDWETHLLHFETANTATNIAIDSIWFDQPILQPGFNQQIHVQLKNHGHSAIENIAVQLELNDELKGATETTVNPKSSKIVTFSTKLNQKGHYKGKVNITAGEPYFDNQFYFAFNVEASIPILAIDDNGGEIFKKLYQDDIYQLDITPSHQINYGSLSSYALIILNELDNIPSGLINALQQNLEYGNNIVVIPNLQKIEASKTLFQNLQLPGFTGLSETEIQASQIVYKDMLFKNVFSETNNNPQLPKVKKHINLTGNVRFPLIQLENGNALVGRMPKGNGQIIYFTTDLHKESSALVNHAIIVPIFLNAALYSTPKNPLYNSPSLKIGQQYPLEENTESPLSIDVNQQRFIPQQRQKGNKVEILNIPTAIAAGTYPVKKDNDVIGYLALNTNTKESKWDFWTKTELEENFEGKIAAHILEGQSFGLTAAIHDLYNGVQLWRWFLIAAILFVLIEILLIKLWK